MYCHEICDIHIMQIYTYIYIYAHFNISNIGGRKPPTATQKVPKPKIKRDGITVASYASQVRYATERVSELVVGAPTRLVGAGGAAEVA